MNLIIGICLIIIGVVLNQVAVANEAALWPLLIVGLPCCFFGGWHVGGWWFGSR